MQAVHETNESIRDAAVTGQVGRARLLTGLVQGGLLYWLYRASRDTVWPATDPFMFYPLLMLSLLVPVLLVSSLGHLNGRQLLRWLGAVVLVIVACSLHDAWRRAEWRPKAALFPSFYLFAFCVCFLYIAHSLVLAGVRDGRRLAQYETYFESAWKLFLQLVFSAFFVGTMWAVLFLGSALFDLIKLRFMRDLLGKSWFVVPVICFAFSCAMHVTDVRPAIVRGIRTLLLVLLSWILPIATLLVAGFLGGLLFTGLEPLWQTRRATSVLLGATAMLVVLINAAFQHGGMEQGVARMVRFSARIAACLLLPLTAIGIYALGLRVAGRGWSTDRVIAAACLLVAAFYAVGYLYAALRKGPWLQALAQVNVAAALLVLAVLLALYTPLADPARISVNNQVERLKQGRVTPEHFDFGFLRFEGQRYGRDALQELSGYSQGAHAPRIRELAAIAAKATIRSSYVETEAITVGENLTIWPKGAKLPAGFPLSGWNLVQPDYGLPRCLREKSFDCDAFVLDMTGDDKPEVLLISNDGSHGAALMSEVKGKWQMLGRLPYDVGGCDALLQTMRSGGYRAIAPTMRDLEVGGVRIKLESGEFTPSNVCADLGK